MKLKTKLMRSTSRLPVFKTTGAAAMDLYADILHMTNDRKEPIASDGELNILPGQIIKVPVGVAVELEPGKVMFIKGRSGNSTRGLIVIEGTIDRDYRGEIHVILKNDTRGVIRIAQGDRIAQGIVQSVENLDNGFEFDLVDELSPTERGEGGFGHTGN